MFYGIHTARKHVYYISPSKKNNREYDDDLSGANKITFICICRKVGVIRTIGVGVIRAVVLRYWEHK